MKITTAVTAVLCSLASTASASEEYYAALTEIARGTISSWISEPIVVETLRSQNARTSTLSEKQILSLDETWRAQTISGGALVDGLLKSPLSGYLSDLKADGAGRYGEIFIADGRGLNAGQSDITSDYWQGDEQKWQVPHATFQIHIGDVEFDESTQTYQSQVSVPILDGSEFLGVITVGVDLEQIASLN